MKRRTALALPLAALAAQLTDSASASPFSPGAKPDPAKESHQLAIMLLLMEDLGGQRALEVFFKPYDSTTYPASIFGKNNVDSGVFKSAQAAYGNDSSRKALRTAIKSLRAQARIMGAQVQATTVYDPADPCPYGDANGSDNVKKLTK